MIPESCSPALPVPVPDALLDAFELFRRRLEASGCRLLAFELHVGDDGVQLRVSVDRQHLTAVCLENPRPGVHPPKLLTRIGGPPVPRSIVHGGSPVSGVLH